MECWRCGYMYADEVPIGTAAAFLSTVLGSSMAASY